MIPREQYTKHTSATIGWLLIDLDDKTESAFHVLHGTSVVDQHWLPKLWEIYQEYHEYGDVTENEVLEVISTTESEITSLKAKHFTLQNKIRELSSELKETESKIEVMTALIKKVRASYEIRDVDDRSYYEDYEDDVSDDWDY